MIRVEKLTKRFDGPGGGSAVTALDAIDLRADEGEVVTVVGPSGSGKSTLLFTLGGLLHPDGGSVHVAETDLYLLDAGERAALRRTEVGFVFQTFNLVPYLDCLENVALPARLAGRGRADAAEAARAMLGRLGLLSRARHRPAQLSGGERQRVGIGRSLINGPKVLLADEPTGNLDPVSARGVMDLFLEIAGEGRTVIAVTHDPRVAEMGDRVVEMRAGRIEGQRPGLRSIAVAS
jgi:putative ABC transport system ATP-binding protein